MSIPPNRTRSRSLRMSPSCMTCSQVNESPTFLRIQIFIPEPPPGHPLFDAEAQKKFEQFKELASSLHQWIREHTTIMQVTTHQSGIIRTNR